MKTTLDSDLLADSQLYADEADSEFDEWTLDELDSSADLNSLRSAWTRADEFTE